MSSFSKGRALFVNDKARILTNSETSMTNISSRTSNYLSSFILKFIVMVLVSLSLFVFPANAITSGDNSASSHSNLVQFAQTRVCRRPKVMINGVCRRPILLKCRPGGNRRCGKSNTIRNPANLRKPVRRCLPPSQIINGRCTQPIVLKPIRRCLPPSKIINGRCTQPVVLKPIRRCLPPSKIINGLCVPATPIRAGVIPECPRFFVRVRGRCERIQLQKTCPPTQARVGNRCVPLAVAVKCLPPLVRIDGRCVRLNPVISPCVPPKKMIRGQCQLPGLPILPIKCNPPLKRINGVCKIPGLGNLCIPPQKMIGGACRLPAQFACPLPRILRGGLCVLPNPRCQAPLVRSPITNRCYLPFVIDDIPEAECRPPWFYSERSGGCVKLRPRLRSRESVVWVQSCLNTLGHRAGVEDGIPGRQTRSAWEDFRRALGLRGIVGFNDPETLGALYRECNSEPRQVAQPRPAEPSVPSVPVVEPPLEPASDLKYRQSMCATGKLYSLLSKTYGDTIQLEQCGGACLPIPEGMAEADVRRLETDQGIQWCKDCVKIGDEGILCPAPTLQ